MKIIISTFGVESGGIIDGIKHFGCEKLILLISDKPQKGESLGELKKIEKTARQMNIPIEKVKISPYLLMENIQKIKNLIKSQEGNEIILNITGGRKPLSLAATLAGFVSNPSKIVYLQEENHQPIEIPKFTLGEKILTKGKRVILCSIEKNTTLKEIINSIESDKSNKYHNVKKHLRELSEAGLIIISKERPQTYMITPSGELLR